MGDWQYTYKAKIVKVIDGDTLVLDVSLGFRMNMVQSFRLFGIDTPETYGVKKDSAEYQAGMAAKIFMENLLPVGTEVEIQTYKDQGDKYGRYLADVYLNGENINQRLLKEGFARAYIP